MKTKKPEVRKGGRKKLTRLRSSCILEAAPEISEAEINKAISRVWEKAENRLFGKNIPISEFVKEGIKLGQKRAWEDRITENNKMWEEGCADGLKRGRDEVLEAYENAVKNIKARTSHPLSDMLPEMKKQGLKVGILDGGWINWFDLQNELETIKSKFEGGKR